MSIDHEVALSTVTLPSGLQGTLEGTAAMLRFPGGVTVSITGTLPTFPPPGTGTGTTALIDPALVDKLIELYEKWMGTAGGGDGGDTVTVTVKGAGTKKVTVTIN